jgi:PAS domain S-box-containing protein
MEYRIEHRAVNPETGEFRWVRTIGRASYAPDGTPTRFDGINYDITEQKMAENALKESERKYRRLIETAHEGIWVIDRENKTSFVNEKMAQMLGCTKEELYGTSLFAFVDLGEESAAQNYIQRRRQDIAEQHDFKFRRKDGSVFWALISTNPIFDDSGAYLGALGMISDITDRKQAEDTLLRLNEILDQKVAERTTLANKRARLLQSLAIELIETEEKERERISQLLHEDLQQLLASAKMHLQVAQETLRPNNLLSYIESLLEESISKSRNLAQELSPPILNHSTLVASLNWLSRRMHEQFGLHAELCADRINDFENSPLKIFIFRSVQELLYNVVKHSGENNAKVDLSIAESDLMVRVSDKGKGFDPNILNGVKSSGLGLVSLRERVHYMGGTFSVEGATGQGCCITLILPINTFTEQSQLATDAENLSECFSASTKVKGMKIRVLVVDDHNVMRKGLVKLISSQKGIQVVGEASDGQQGIELARQLVPEWTYRCPCSMGLRPPESLKPKCPMCK